MAAFIEKQDYFDIADDTQIVCISSTDGNSAEVAEATGEDGTIVASNVYGEKLSPSNEYQLKTDYVVSAGDLKLGGVTTVNGKSICLSTIDINTSAGSAPTFNVSGEQVEDNSQGGCTFSIPAFTLSKKHHAQILFGAFTFNKVVEDIATGVHLKSSSYNISCSVTKGVKEGNCLTHDVIEAKIECSVEFIQTGSTIPSITKGNEWEITSPLACSNPDADWPTWSATLTMYLVKDIEA